MPRTIDYFKWYTCADCKAEFLEDVNAYNVKRQLCVSCRREYWRRSRKKTAFHARISELLLSKSDELTLLEAQVPYYPQPTGLAIYREEYEVN